MQIWELKAWEKYFELVAKGVKRFEWRKKDRDIKEGDLIYLRETHNGTREFTGRVQLVRVDCVISAPELGMPEEYVIYGITPVKMEITPLKRGNDT